MRVHPPAAGPRIVRDIGVGVELPEELVERSHAEGQDEGLIAVIARAPVALAEGARPGELRHFLAVAKNAELRLAGEHLLAADQTGLATAKGDAVVLENALAGELGAGLFLL